MGKKKAGTHVGSQAYKPRPLIVRFLDYNHRQLVKDGRTHLPAGLYISEDLPAEVRAARKKLHGEFTAAKNAGREVWITYPARLIVDGEEVNSVSPASMIGKTHPPRGPPDQRRR